LCKFRRLIGFLLLWGWDFDASTRAEREDHGEISEVSEESGLPPECEASSAVESMEGEDGPPDEPEVDAEEVTVSEPPSEEPEPPEDPDTPPEDPDPPDEGSDPPEVDDSAGVVPATSAGASSEPRPPGVLPDDWEPSPEPEPP
jgi:hypothetical protein